MRPLQRDEIVDRERYEALRSGYREAVITHKRHRRMAVGDRVTLVFEDRETLRFQVQEMLWVERISEPEKIQHELDVYNELMPADRELSATLFLEITDPGAVRPELDRLVGIPGPKCRRHPRARADSRRPPELSSRDGDPHGRPAEPRRRPPARARAPAASHGRCVGHRARDGRLVL
jgi:hypothetical protein